MGEMIKFGIKIGLTVACAVALMAALVILFNLITTATNFAYNTNIPLFNIFSLVSLVFPLNLRGIFTIISSLFAFKVAYWAADKMIQFINALG